jgi:hypothetical protein
MKLKTTADIKVGLVVYFKPVGTMAPPANLNVHAQALLHPFVCTHHDSNSGVSQWLFLSSKDEWTPKENVFKQDDKDGERKEWLETDSYFVPNCCVEVENPYSVVKASEVDTFQQTTFIKAEALKRFGDAVLKKKEKQ